MEPLLLTEHEKAVLEQWSQRTAYARTLAARAQVILACAGPHVPLIASVARDLRVSTETVSRWRRRFLAHRLDSLTTGPDPVPNGRSQG
ncbi:helix-turn-helix domain-containing protein [Streptomyces sp. NPDC059070]|uniref:helix-turn-helix domain-containing protein n=1 Tax=unclassified Streptomyces TaxID=2593676 RepID=UPI0034E22350